MSARNRNGLTIVEVAVLLVFVLIVPAVFLSWMVLSREQLRGMDCHNKLKQIGLALHNYEETHRAFPLGWVAVRGPSSGEHEQSAYGWMTYLLPYMEQQPLYGRIAFGADDPSFQTQTDGTRGAYARVSLREFNCPSNYAMIDRTSSVAEIATTTYVGNFGVGIPTLHHDSQVLQGVFGSNSRIRIRDVRDGTTNVVLVGERMLPSSGRNWPTNQIEGPFNSYWAGIPRGTNPLAIVATSTDGDISTYDENHEEIWNVKGALNALSVTPPQLRAILANKTVEGKSLSVAPNLEKQVSAGFSSYHQGYAMILLGDSSVRGVNEYVDPNTWINLMRRSDGETLGEF